MSGEEVCKEHSGTCANIVALGEKIDSNAEENREAHKQLWEAINSLRNRLPVWATLFISFLTMCLGWTLSLLFH
ncbi:hypothetical protein [Candidatus Formimonas warabiya]|uniref:Uncharacterized protein n=1 Tax=Formimonas warabiya TaxID=1761012 RepID=A0A3G1KRP7_FORW1|nr:hypothetical protein [Candidatus Formimonas warabiya]ATW24805.1 hypothetical protein DCMF_08485 [Candidatus Formimonas warabiya]